MVLATTNTNESFDYEERVVAFIDVLGFASLVERSDTNLSSRANIAKLITVSELFDQFVSEYLDFAEAAFFSDSFILSMGPPDVRTLFVIREVGYLCRYLLWQGFPCRGAITTGALYHRGRFVVGPALVSAYRLEQSAAIYPRVILDDQTMRHWQNEFDPASPHSNFKSMVKRDHDGQYFLDIFSPEWSTTLAWTEFLPSYDQLPTDSLTFLEETGKHIAAGLRAHSGNSKIREKYEWLATQRREHVTSGNIAAAMR
ncbi:MAG TPA: hypothetical protein VEK75_08615 [Xanthobacteraceae bacterium]|nr:hypothetical protein [Xanthobacteraceae bacterium]